MNSLTQTNETITTRLQQLAEAKDHAGKYENAVNAASAALNAAKKQQADASSHLQVL